jgi:hypothetical protein
MLNTAISAPRTPADFRLAGGDVIRAGRTGVDYLQASVVGVCRN